jgi:23S rRNA (uracil1939-C5)-methyltransferase
MMDTFELELEAMAHGGSALGRHEGRTVFVPYTIPGERIEARLTGAKGRAAFAEGVRLLDASADRVFPRCPHFGPHKCGRCHWQHIAYSAQLLLKQDILADQLARVGGFDEADVRALIPSPEEWYYNDRITMLPLPDGSLGYPSADPGHTFAISECHIIHPDLLALKEALNLETVESLQQVRLARGSDGALMVMLSLPEAAAPELEVDVDASVNLLLEDNEPVNLVGETHTRHVVGGRSFRATAGSSFRANTAALDNLVSVVLDALALTGSEKVLDLYAGVGLFTAFAAPRAESVTMVESYPPAATDAETNLDEFENVTIIEGAVEDFLDEPDEAYDVVILDPPPEGLSIPAMDGLAALGAARLVYVSSDPASLARDAKRLAAHGYNLRTVQPLDLAPQTYYIDAVAVFER